MQIIKFDNNPLIKKQSFSSHSVSEEEDNSNNSSESENEEDEEEEQMDDENMDQYGFFEVQNNAKDKNNKNFKNQIFVKD